MFFEQIYCALHDLILRRPSCWGMRSMLNHMPACPETGCFSYFIQKGDMAIGNVVCIIYYSLHYGGNIQIPAVKVLQSSTRVGQLKRPLGIPYSINIMDGVYMVMCNATGGSRNAASKIWCLFRINSIKSGRCGHLLTEKCHCFPGFTAQYIFSRKNSVDDQRLKITLPHLLA